MNKFRITTAEKQTRLLFYYDLFVMCRSLLLLLFYFALYIFAFGSTKCLEKL